jgi:hypothetical protein
MRLYEFADAEAQLGLLRIIIDNTWSAIAQQAEQEQRAEAERKAQAKLKPRAKKSSKGTSIRIPTTPPPLTNKQQAPLDKQPPPPLNKPNPDGLNSPSPTSSHPKQLPISTTINPKPASLPQPNPAVNTPIKPITGVKIGNFVNKNNTVQDFANGSESF